MGTLVQEVVTGMLAALLRDSEHRFGSGEKWLGSVSSSLSKEIGLGF